MQPNQYLIKKHSPRRALLIKGGLFLTTALVLWGSFVLGQHYAGYSQRAAQTEINYLIEQIRLLNVRIDELQVNNALLTSNSEIDAAANAQVAAKLQQLNEEILELKEELVFYRSLLTPAELEPGLQILGMQLIKHSADSYNYKVVLTQRRTRDRFAAGNIDLRLSGLNNGEQTELELKQLMRDNNNKLSFRFKNFQSLEGRLNLPTGFEPQKILVSAIPTSRGLKPVERSYSWNSIMTGG